MTKKPQCSLCIMLQHPWTGSQVCEVPETWYRMELPRVLIHLGSGCVSDLLVWVSLLAAMVVIPQETVESLMTD